MLVLACAALTLAALLYVFWLSPERVREKTAAEREREYLEEKREVLYDNLRDLHLEYRMGKLSDQDYKNMKATYQGEMAALLAELEKNPGPGLPVQVPQSGKEAGLPAGARLPRAEARGRAQAGRCPACGQDNPATNRFCGACGAQLPFPEMIQ